MITSIELITDELLRNGLLNDESLGETCHALEKRGDAITGQNLLSLLTAEGKLTPFQAEEIGQGRANQLLLGNYLVLSKLGEGGMGTVFKALHRRMQRLVAVKVIRKEVATREGSRSSDGVGCGAVASAGKHGPQGADRDRRL